MGWSRHGLKLHPAVVQQRAAARLLREWVAAVERGSGQIDVAEVDSVLRRTKEYIDLDERRRAG